MESGSQLHLARNLMNLRMERYGMLVLGLRRYALLAPLLQLADSWQGRVYIQLDDSGDTDLDWAAFPAGMTEAGWEIRFCRQASSDEYTLRLLLIPVLALLAWYVRKRIIKPITLLSSASRRIERGELGVTFSNMSRRIEQLIDKTYKEELELKNAQIQALQSRINPHFLNNALEAINWQARIGNHFRHGQRAERAAGGQHGPAEPAYGAPAGGNESSRCLHLLHSAALWGRFARHSRYG